MMDDSTKDVATPDVELPTTKLCWLAQIVIVLIATMLHGIFLSKAKPLQSANDRSRWCTVWSLVERGSFQIDEIRQRPGWDTIDMVRVDDHFYSTKPPLLTTIIAGITWCVQRLTGWDLLRQTQLVTFTVLLIVNLLPFMISLFVWIAIVNRLTQQTASRLFATSIASFGTLVTPFLMTLNNHTVATASVMIAIYGLLRILDQDDQRPAVWPYLVCGFFSSWTAVNELPAAFFAAIALLLAFRRSRRLSLMYFAPAAAIPLIALVATNMISTGSWKPVYADYGSDRYRFIVDGIPSYWMEPHGVDLNRDSPWIYFVHCIVGHHGLLSLTPIWLFALFGWLLSFRAKPPVLRTLSWVGALTTAVILAFYLTRTQNYNYGGVSCGLRWAVWLTPFWLIAMLPILDICASSKLAKGIAIPLVIVSFYSAWNPIENPWRQPWLFQWMEARGWIDYSEPPPQLSHEQWTWFASLPTSDLPAWIEFNVDGPVNRTVRLTASPEVDGINSSRVRLEIREKWEAGGPPEQVRSLLILTDEFTKGAMPADFVRWDDSNLTQEQKIADLTFLRGLPRKIRYSPRTTRYLKTSLRPEALRCTLAVAHVSIADEPGRPPRNHRCEAWLSDAVPFGVAQINFQVTDPVTTAVVFHERWTVRDCSPKVLPYQKPE